MFISFLVFLPPAFPISPPSNPLHVSPLTPSQTDGFIFIIAVIRVHKYVNRTY